MQDQYGFITRNANFEDVALVANDRAILEDIGCNADLYILYHTVKYNLYIANQEDDIQI